MRTTIAALLLLLLSVTAHAQSFRYSQFNAGTLQTVGNAYAMFGLLQLTGPGAAQRGAAWHVEPVRVDSVWSTCIMLRISETGGAPDWSMRDGGDGMAFVIQTSSPSIIGAGGGGMGYEGLTSTLAIEVDTWDDTPHFQIWNAGYRDDGSSHLAVHSNGRGIISAIPQRNRIAQAAAIPDPSDGMMHELRISYTPGELRVTFDGIERLRVPVRLDTLLTLDSGRAWIGITAATGNAYERHTVYDWCFATLPSCEQPCPPDTVIVRDTVTLRDTITVRDTVRLQARDTVTVRDTVVQVRADTVIIRDSITVRDTVVRVDTLVLRDTVTRRDTIYIRDTITVHDTIPRTWDNLDTVCFGDARAIVPAEPTLAVRPNPSFGTVTVSHSIVRPALLTIVDPSGHVVRWWRVKGDGRVTAALESGGYQAILDDGMDRWRVPFVVVK